MKLDELYKFIGYSLVCLLMFYVAAKSVRFQLGVVEGWVGIKPQSSASDTAQKPAEAEQNAAEKDKKK